ncbi:MAG: hypothetical protein GY774_00240 [Planctomycetes bacterium]|nr:hypothetical protein [Planctomycetota bacterium]
MKCSDYVKSLGLKNIKDLSEKSGVGVRTLQNRYKNNRVLFDADVKRVKEIEPFLPTTYKYGDLKKLLRDIT